MLIGIVIPVYNGAQYIMRAVNSVINQTYKDWKLIVVDDCSTDNTAEVLLNNCTDERVFMIQHKKNRGAGVSRQTGNAALKDVDFITYLDADDYWKPDFLDMCVRLQQQHDSDIVYTSFSVQYTKETKVIPAGDYIMAKEATLQLYYWNKIKFLTGKLFRRSLIDTVQWSNRRVGEDCQTLYFLLYNAQRVRSSSYTGYIHVFRPGSLLANAPFFYCYCESTLAQTEIIEFLIKKKDERLIKYELGNIKRDYLKVIQAIKTGKIPAQDVQKNKARWNEVVEWFRYNRALFR